MGNRRLLPLLFLLATGCTPPPPPRPVDPQPGSSAAPPETLHTHTTDPEVALGPSPPPRPRPVEPRKIPAPGEDPDFPAKTKAKPGDWLAHFPEEGQTVEEYRQECVNRRAADRKTIVIQLLGESVAKREALVEQVRAYGAIYFGVDVKVAPGIPIPKGAFDERRKQCDGDILLRRLEVLMPEKCLAFVGLCDEDLWSGNLNFVFGVATLRRRTGVYSLHRYGGDGDAKFLVRALKVFAHETGHILGMEHCIRYECVMNGSNSLPETDRAPLFPCPECHEKLRWNTGFDPRARYEALAAFLEGAGLRDEAAFALRQSGKLPAR